MGEEQRKFDESYKFKFENMSFDHGFHFTWLLVLDLIGDEGIPPLQFLTLCRIGTLTRSPDHLTVREAVWTF